MNEQQMEAWARRECRKASLCIVFAVVYTVLVCVGISKGWW